MRWRVGLLIIGMTLTAVPMAAHADAVTHRVHVDAPSKPSCLQWPLGTRCDSPVTLLMANFRFCAGSIVLQATENCSPDEYGYVRSPVGPVPVTDNPTTIISVPEGATVIWAYRDVACDALAGCPGHNVSFEDGTPTGASQGNVPSAPGPVVPWASYRGQSPTIEVVLTQPRGTTLRYFCNIHGDVGMTGILRIV